MYISDKILNFCLLYQLVFVANSDNSLNSNHMSAADIEKRRSVREFFDSLVAGSSPNTKTSSQGVSDQNPTQRPNGPIYMPFAVPVHQPPPSQHSPHVHHMSPPSFGFPSGAYESRPPPMFRNPPPHHPSHHGPHHGPHHAPHHGRPHMSFVPISQNYGPHGSHSHNFASIASNNPGYPPQSHHYPMPPGQAYQHNLNNQYDFGASNRPIAIAIPLPLHAIPLHLFPQNNKHNNYLPNTDYTDDMSASNKFALFADPFEDMVEDDLFDAPPPRFNFIPIHKSQ